MELKPIDFLSVLSGRETLPVLHKHVNAALFDEKFEVEGCIALSHSGIVKHSLALFIPFGDVKLVSRVVISTVGPEDLDRVELSIFNGKVHRCLF